VPDTNRARHLRSSARRGCPASHHVFFTRVAYASPSRGLALRHRLHGSARFILAVLARAFALPKALRRCVPTEGGHPCRPAQHLLQPTALSLRFSISACADYLAAPHSRPRRAAAERHRWAGGFLGLRLQLGSSRPASIGSAQEPPCPHTTAHVIFARRPAFSFLPATAASSLAPRMLRRRSPSRFARGFTARHGSFLPCPPVTEALQKALYLVCAD
jgi:hypothetical protein